MPLPAIYDVAQRHLYDDQDKMVSAGLPAATITHVLRLRDAYNFWISHPSKKERDIVELLKKYGLSKSQAYNDLSVVKQLVGALQRNTKDYIRYIFTQGVLRNIERAEAKGNDEVAIKGWEKLAKYYQLDKPDEEDRRFDIIPQQFKFTDDPTVAGFKPIPNIREKIRKKKEQYWNDDIQDVDFEPVDFNEDEIFNPKHGAKKDIPQ